ncbi:MAG: universal stress protein [Deltaproteobacteria bacterium]|nr:universal stress protein [Deltaproteobacteria bacterium]
MFKKIYVPIDNSDYSNRAGDVAVMLGKMFGATLVGGHVYAARLHGDRFKQMEVGLPGRYVEGGKLEQQREAHNSLMALGLKLISDSYLDILERKCQQAGVTFERKTFDGRHYRVLSDDIEASGYDLVVMGALGIGAVKESLIGSVCERLVRRITTDALIVKPASSSNGTGGPIVAAIDGSPWSFAGLKTALNLSKALERPVEAVAVYDPYLHRALFSSIVKVLSERAAQVFRFQEQERLHEEIIDRGLAKIYQSHLETAQQMAKEDGVGLKITLLDGKVFEKILHHIRDTSAWLLVIGRDGIHSGEWDGVDLGSNAENLLRLAPCNVYLCGRKLSPAVDAQVGFSNKGLRGSEERGM